MTRTRSRLGRPLAFTIAALTACAPLFPVGAEAQDDSKQLVLSLRVTNGAKRPNLLADLLNNCNLFFSNGISPSGRTRVLYAKVDGAPVGALDFAAGGGEAILRGDSWQVEALPPTRAKPVQFADLGIALSGRSIFLTSRITRGRSLLAGARRARLAMVRGTKIEQGPLLDRDDKPAPNTFTTIAIGRLRMLSAMSRAVERTRCKNRRQNRRTRRLKPGYELGQFAIEYRPDKASGLAGDARLEPRVETADDGTPVAVQPGPGSSTDADGKLVAPIAAGLPVPLTCIAGANCSPSGGSFGLGGGFDLVFGNRRTSVGNIAVATSGTAPSELRQAVTGTLDGAPVAIAEAPVAASLPLTADFRRRAGAALGVEVEGSLGVQALFTRTGP